MRPLPLSLICLIPLIPSQASAQPRINQISPHPSLSSSGYRIEDIDGDGFRDIILEDTHGYTGQRSLVIRNLGDRNFAAPLHTHYRVVDSFSHPVDLRGLLVELSEAGGWNHLSLPLECSGPCGYFRIRGSAGPATE